MELVDLTLHKTTKIGTPRKLSHQQYFDCCMCVALQTYEAHYLQVHITMVEITIS